jgi:integrase
LGSKRVNLISTRELEAWLDDRDQSPKTRNNYVVTLRTFFGYCLAQKWCAENPALSLGKARVEDAPAGILSVAEARCLLNAVEEHDARMLPTVLIQLFAGLRRSEACALDWSEVKPEVIEVTAIKAKTRSRRVVTIQPNLKLWLASDRKLQGRVCPVGEDAYNEALRQAIEQHNERAKKEGGVPTLEWKRNCLRHTCASMHLAHFSDEAKTALQMGHAVDVLHRHYKGLVTPEEAAKFWEITPAESGANNVIPLKVAAPPRSRKAS